jgi:hypothetical protein
MKTRTRLSTFIYNLTVLAVIAGGLFMWWFWLHP